MHLLFAVIPAGSCIVVLKNNNMIIVLFDKQYVNSTCGGKQQNTPFLINYNVNIVSSNGKMNA